MFKIYFMFTFLSKSQGIKSLKFSCLHPLLYPHPSRLLVWPSQSAIAFDVCILHSVWSLHHHTNVYISHFIKYNSALTHSPPPPIRSAPAPAPFGPLAIPTPALPASYTTSLAHRRQFSPSHHPSALPFSPASSLVFSSQLVTAVTALIYAPFAFKFPSATLTPTPHA